MSHDQKQILIMQLNPVMANKANIKTKEINASDRAAALQSAAGAVIEHQ